MRAASRRVGCDTEVVESGALNPLVIVMRNANKNSNIVAFFKIEDYSGILNGFPRSFQEQAMLRVDVRRLARRDAKKLRVKLIDLFQESAAFGKSLSGNSRLGIIIPLHVPPVRRCIGYRILAFDQ